MIRDRLFLLVNAITVKLCCSNIAVDRNADYMIAQLKTFPDGWCLILDPDSPSFFISGFLLHRMSACSLDPVVFYH